MKKFSFSKLFLAVTLAVATLATTFVGCKNYDDDIKRIDGELAKIANDIKALQTEIGKNPISSVKKEANGDLTFVLSGDGAGSVTLANSARVASYTIQASADGKSFQLYKDGVAQNPAIVFPVTAGQKVEVKDGILYINDQPQSLKSINVEVKDGYLYINGEKQDLLLDDTRLVDMTDYWELTIPGQGTAKLAKYSAGSAITSIQLIRTENGSADSWDYTAIKLYYGVIPVAKTQDEKVLLSNDKWRTNYAKGAHLFNAERPVVVQLNPAAVDATKVTFKAFDSQKKASKFTFGNAAAYNELITRTATANGLWTLPVTFPTVLDKNAAEVATTLSSYYGASAGNYISYAISTTASEVQSNYYLAYRPVEFEMNVVGATASGKNAYIGDDVVIENILNYDVSGTYSVNEKVSGAVIDTRLDFNSLKAYAIDSYVEVAKYDNSGNLMVNNIEKAQDFGVVIDGNKVKATKGTSTAGQSVTFYYWTLFADGTKTRSVSTISFQTKIGDFDAILSSVKGTILEDDNLAAVNRKITVYSETKAFTDKIASTTAFATWSARANSYTANIEITPASVTLLKMIFEDLQSMSDEAVKEFIETTINTSGLFTIASTLVEKNDGTGPLGSLKFPGNDAKYKYLQLSVKFNSPSTDYSMLLHPMLSYNYVVKYSDSYGLPVNTISFPVNFAYEDPNNLSKKTDGMWDGLKLKAYGMWDNASNSFFIDMKDAYKTNAYFITRSYKETLVNNTAVYDFSVPTLVSVKKADIKQAREVETILTWVNGDNAKEKITLEFRSAIEDGSFSVKNASDITYTHNVTTKSLFASYRAFTATSKLGGAYNFFTKATYNGMDQLPNPATNYKVKSISGDGDKYFTATVDVFDAAYNYVPSGTTNTPAAGELGLIIVPIKSTIVMNVPLTFNVTIEATDIWGIKNTFTVPVIVKDK